MSLELVATVAGKIKCTATIAPSGGTEPIGVPFGESDMLPMLSFTSGSNYVNISATYIKSQYTSVDDNPILLDKIILTAGTVFYNGYTGQIPRVEIESKLTENSTCISDLGNKILLKGASGSVSVELVLTGSPPIQMTFVFTISDAGQTSTTAE